MVDPRELEPRMSPPEVLFDAVVERQRELMYLGETFAPTLELVLDTERVNGLISASSRPELVLTERVPQKQMKHPFNHGFNVNNFVPNLQGFGIPVRVDVENPEKYQPQTKMIGRRQLTSDELSAWFDMGARGGYNDYLAYAEQAGVDSEVAKDMCLNSLIGEEAFMRLWIAAPDLTEYLIRRYLDEIDVVRPPLKEELFVAYTLMSQLVDIGDKEVIRQGELDNWLLCH